MSDGRINLGRRFTVLVMDDESSILRMLGRSLDQFGYATLEAKSADEALIVLRANRVDAAILDVRLPGGTSGLELLETFRTDKKLAKLPVLILTGNMLTLAESQRVRQLDAHLFYKPSRVEAIAEKLDELLKHKRT
ncbi:MAG: response regulator [Acidimicrobiia bacterium]|nr:response regulator [Acidimicrobiia bacterium]